MESKKFLIICLVYQWKNSLIFLKTIAMNKLCKTDTQTNGKFYPYKGTPVRRMLIEKGWLNEEREKEITKGYDFNSLTDHKSVLEFDQIDTDLNGKLLNRISKLFLTYIVWPVKLWPLLDVIKIAKDNDEFINHLGQKLNEVTYFIKFNEWPNELLSNDKKVNIISYNFNDKTANKFSKLLLERWGSKFRDEIDLLLTKIQKNIVSAEFPIPEDEKELEKFVGIESYSEEEKEN